MNRLVQLLLSFFTFSIFSQASLASPQVEFELIAKTGSTQIPGSSQSFSEFGLYAPAIDNDGNIVFIGGTSLSNLGVYTYKNGQLQLVADQNTLIPNGGGATFKFDKNDYFDIDNGRVVFRSTLNTNPTDIRIFSNIGQNSETQFAQILKVDDVNYTYNQGSYLLGGLWADNNKVGFKIVKPSPSPQIKAVLWDGSNNSTTFPAPPESRNNWGFGNLALSGDSYFYNVVDGSIPQYIGVSKNGVDKNYGALFRNMWPDGLSPNFQLTNNGENVAFSSHNASQTSGLGKYLNGDIHGILVGKYDTPVPNSNDDILNDFKFDGYSLANNSLSFTTTSKNGVTGLYTDVGGSISTIVDDRANNSIPLSNGQTLYVLQDNKNAVLAGSHAFAYTSQGYELVFIATLTNGDKALIKAKVEDLPMVNIPPIANAGGSRTVTDADDSGSETVKLDASASYDSDGFIIAYKWYIDGQPRNANEVTYANLTVGTHTLKLEVEDNYRNKATDTITIEVLPPGGTANEAPVANAGADQTVKDSDSNGQESVVLNGLASLDSDGSIISYAWRIGGQLIAAGATTNVNLAVGSHTITLTVTDDDGATDTDTVIVTVLPADPPPNQAPTAAFTYNCDNLTCTFNGNSSSDSDGNITTYQWGASDGMQKSGASISHTFASPGSYNVQLTVTDDDGAQDQELKTITVSEPPPIDNPPTVSITSPSNGATVSGSVLIQATASDDNAVASVKFYINGALVKTDTSAPYSYSWDTTQATNGSNSLQAVAFDSANQTDSASLSVNVNNAAEPPADTEKPSVSITSPEDGAVISGGSRLTLQASASDNVAVSNVRFYVDGSLICTDSTANYSCSWRMPKAKNKTYRIQATATDSSGNQSSDVINISSGGSSGGGGKPGGGDKPCRGKKCN